MEEVSQEVVSIASTTDHKHFYTEGTVNGSLKDVICECGHGLQIPSETEVKNGEVLWIK